MPVVKVGLEASSSLFPSLDGEAAGLLLLLAGWEDVFVNSPAIAFDWQRLVGWYYVEYGEIAQVVYLRILLAKK